MGRTSCKQPDEHGRLAVATLARASLAHLQAPQYTGLAGRTDRTRDEGAGIGRALDSAAEEWKPISHRSTVGGDVYWWSAEQWGSTIPLVPFVHIAVTKDVYIDGRLPFVMAINGIGDTTRAGIGNPTVGAHYASTVDRFTWFVGGLISAPIAAIDDDDFQLADVQAGLTMAAYDSYLWLPNYLPIAASGGIEYKPVDALFLRASVEPIFFIPVGKRSGLFDVGGTGDVEFALQSKTEIEARAPMGLGGGIALQTVWFPTEEGAPGLRTNKDNAQVSLEPFLSYDDTTTFFMRVGLLVALDEPLGFGFDHGKVVSPHLEIGGHLD